MIFLDVWQGDIFRYSITILFIPYSCIKLTRAIILTTQPEYLPFHPPPAYLPTPSRVKKKQRHVYSLLVNQIRYSTS